MGRAWRRLTRGGILFGFLMTLPTLIGVFAIMGYPWVYSLWMSLNTVNPLTQEWSFTGLDNYISILSSTAMLNSLSLTIGFAAMVVVGTTAVGLVIALALNASFAGRGFMRTVILIPWAVASVVVGRMFQLIYDGAFGTLNGLLYQLGLIQAYVPWLADGWRALVLIAIASVWSGAPLTALLLLAALQGIPQNLYRAAQVDGASGWSVFRRITLPYLRPMLLLVVILTTINAALAFDLIYVMTQGGPGDSTQVLAWWGYATIYKFSQYGEGAAILYSLSLLILVLSAVYYWLLADRSAARRRQATDLKIADEALARPPSAARSTTSGFARPTIRRGWLAGRTGRRVRRVAFYSVIVLIAVWTLLPFYVTVNASLSNVADFLNKPPRWFPFPPTFANYSAVLFGEEISSGLGQNVQAQAMLISMRNSLVVSLAVTALNVVFGTMGGYAYARFARSKLITGGFWLLMFTRMIPGLTIIVPFYLIFRALHLVDTLSGLIIAYTSFILPLTVWIMKGYFDSVSPTMERAALVDGCGRFAAFVEVAVPVALPGIIAAALFAFIVAWNQFLFAIILTNTPNAQTLPVRIVSFVADQRVYNPAILYAAGIYAILPPLLLTLLLQRYLVQGMTAGAVKG
jgi:multiple sugar transport system permease protein